ncbi:Endopolyphosphatase [Xylona heveae TC161]|uniref:Endopolyphosphatase n=1 Tax=Xylona heveae (strain CBS 132557 / TC161) TaxID=1328760 RepID=A0A165JQ33_XYLHT|nr:Endopolyphosphatase [Xylona heveae TC161]KZF26501.1 Endopolyphosphatase [Xylona heveae TC161]
MRLQLLLALVAAVGSGRTWGLQVNAAPAETQNELRGHEHDEGTSNAQLDVDQELGSLAQQPLLRQDRRPTVQRKKPLTGKFLHITDFHPDPFYKVHSSSEKGDSCHKNDGQIGFYGAEKTDCDSPISLVNATFNWISENIKDEIDFIVWTGDSARHDNDEDIPRNTAQVEGQNQFLVDKFVEVFGKSKDPNDRDPLNNFIVPIIPTYGNNDILPHNIMTEGPNHWTKEYLKIWRKFIPEEQRHQFEKGGWFFVEAIPNKLAVFSLNTLYFFTSNSAVDGCAKKSEPGYQQMEWLRIQLQFLRIRGMKAILIGHVPPARTDSKTSWDESCWQKYSLWLRQYRDVVVGSIYGHMNIDHFILQDFDDIEIGPHGTTGGAKSIDARVAMDDHLTVQSSADYLLELRDDWSDLPKPPEVTALEEYGDPELSVEQIQARLRRKKKRKGHKSRKQKFFEKVGGEFAERYSLSLVSPSIVPNYFPTLRIIEYNVTGLESSSSSIFPLESDIFPTHHPAGLDELETQQQEQQESDSLWTSKKKRKGRKGKKDKLIVPDPPSKSAPPGPAYSPQTLSWLGYTQYFANLTDINNETDALDIALDDHQDADDGHVQSQKKDKKQKPHPKEFNFQVEYSTFNDSIYKLKDMTVMSYLKLAQRIGQSRPTSDEDSWDAQELEPDHAEDESDDEKEDDDQDEEEEASANKSRKRKGKGKGKSSNGKSDKRLASRRRRRKGQKIANKVWYTFVRRAYVDTKAEQDLHDNFGEPL